MAAYFSIFLVIITAVSGVIWLINKYYLLPQRHLKLAEAQSQCQGDLSAEIVEQILEPSFFCRYSGANFSSDCVCTYIAFILVGTVSNSIRLDDAYFT
jgi:hypothetical protein